MFALFPVVISAFILLSGLVLPLPLIPSDADPEALPRLRRKRASYAVLRLFLQGWGAFMLLLHFFRGRGGIEDGAAFALLVLLYSLLILFVQRAEANRRLITLLFMGFSAWLVARYASFRGYDAASDWALYLALLLNLLFWLTLGRYFPVGSSRAIRVWGMDEDF